MYGVLIIAHGTSESGDDIMSKIADMTRGSLQDAEVEYGFISQDSKDFDKIFERFNSLGINEIIVVPYFLFDGHHVKKTIPGIVNRFLDKYPSKKITIKKPLGIDRRLMEIVIDRVLN